MTTGFGPVNRGSNPRPGAPYLVRSMAQVSRCAIPCGHGGAGPALDLPVQAGAAQDFDAQAAVVVVAGVLTNCRRAMPLEARAPELFGLQAGDVQPEPLCCLDIRALVDADCAPEPLTLDASHSEEVHKEANHGWVAVHEDDPVGSAVRLVLASLAPVRDGPRDDGLPVTQLADFIRGGRADCLTLGLADWSLGGPVSADALRGSPAAFLVAQALGPRQVPDP